MLGRALDTAFKNLTTLFCLCAVLVLPLHVAHAFLFRNVHAVSDLAADIAAFPEGRKVRNVGPEELGDERTTALALMVVEAGLFVIVFGGARRVLEVEEGAGVATVPDALSHSISALEGPAPDPLVVLGAIVVGSTAGWLTLLIGYRVSELLGSSTTYLGIGLSRGVAASLAGALIAGTAAASRRPSKPPPKKIDVY